jgi:hypothetical protein
MPWVYILKGSPGRHYIGSAVDLDARLAQHLRGHTATTKRLGDTLEIVAKKKVATLRMTVESPPAAGILCVVIRASRKSSLTLCRSCREIEASSSGGQSDDE